MDITQILFSFAPYTPYIAFGLLILAGCNIPISEEMTIIVSASIASTVVPHLKVQIFLACWIGAFASDFIAYLNGRYLGRRILKTSLGQKLISRRKIERVSFHLEKHAVVTILVGRFIPFGFRNALFMTSGIAKINIIKFLLLDLIPLTITAVLYFCLGFKLGANYESLYPMLDKIKFVIFFLFVIFVIVIIWKKRLFFFKKKDKSPVLSDPVK